MGTKKSGCPSDQNAHRRIILLSPIDPAGKAIAGDLPGFAGRSIDQPEIVLIDDGQGETCAVIEGLR
jgi:hypothetical protein